MRTTYEKLVRDGIPARLDLSAVRYAIRVASPDEMSSLLHAKLDEEVAELREAVSDTDVIDEIADTLEVLLALALQHGADEEMVRARQSAKRTDRGGFERGIVLRWTET